MTDQRAYLAILYIYTTTFSPFTKTLTFPTTWLLAFVSYSSIDPALHALRNYPSFAHTVLPSSVSYVFFLVYLYMS